MNKINLTTDDFSNIVNYIKTELQENGMNYTIKKIDINNLTNNQQKAINNFKSRFGENYLDNINYILKEYVNFKGGVTMEQLLNQKALLRPTLTRIPIQTNTGTVIPSISPMISPSTSPLMVSLSSPSSSSKFKNLGFGLLGQQSLTKSGKPSLANLFGQSVGQSQSLQQISDAATRRLINSISGSKPLMESPYATPNIQTIPQQTYTSTQPEILSLPSEIIIQPIRSESEVNKLIESCKQCNNLRKNINPNSPTTEFDLIAKTCKLCDDFNAKISQNGGIKKIDQLQDIFIPSNISGKKENSYSESYKFTNSESTKKNVFNPILNNINNQNIKKPEIIIKNTLYTIESPI